MSDFVPGWKCPECLAHNAAERTDCRRCGNEIPEGDG